MLEDACVGLIGGGNMGEALIKGIIDTSLLASDKIHVFDVSTSRTDDLKSHSYAYSERNWPIRGVIRGIDEV